MFLGSVHHIPYPARGAGLLCMCGCACMLCYNSFEDYSEILSTKYLRVQGKAITVAYGFSRARLLHGSVRSVGV